MAGEETPNGNPVVIEMLTIDLGVGAEIGQDLAISGSGLDLSVGEIGAQSCHDRFFQVPESLSGNSAELNCSRVMPHEHIEICVIFHAIDFVQDEQLWLAIAAQFLENRVDGLD